MLDLQSCEHEIFLSEKACAEANGGEIRINAQTHSGAIVSYFLRDCRGRSDLAQGITQFMKPGFVQVLEKVRCLLTEGELETAQIEILKVDRSRMTAFEQSELDLEQARLLVFKEEWRTAAELIRTTLARGDLAPWTQLTLHQLMGHCLNRLGQYHDAISIMQAVLPLADCFQALRASIQLRRHLVKSHLLLGQTDRAGEILDRVRKLARSVPDLEQRVNLLLPVKRAECDFAFATRNWPEAWITAREGLEISKFLKDRVTLRYCERNLESLKGNHTMDAISSPPRTSELIVFQHWTYLARLGLLLHFAPPKVLSLENHETLVKALLILASHSYVSLADFFEKLWEQKYFQHLHETNVRMCISKLRRVLPTDSVMVRNGQISITL